MKLKNVVQIAVLGVIGFVLAMGIGMLTGLLGVVSLYVSAGFGAFFVAPVYVIMARKVQKRGASFLFWLIIGLLYIAMGYWIATPICVVAGIIAELIVGDYSNKIRIAMAFSASMFIYAMHPILFVVLLGAENIARFVSSMSLEQAQMMVASYTGNVIVICVLVNIVLELIAGRFGLFINNKFFEKNSKQSRLS